MGERKYLFPQNCNIYKANLHCHTTLSDGKLTPEEIKSAYKAEGYSIVAFTDHRIVVPHPELEDEDFLPLTASEFDCNELDVPWPATRTYHLNFISKDKNRTEFIPFTRVHSVEGVNKVIADAAKEGFLCQYNHPRWSIQKPEDFCGLKGIYAFEIYNTGCELELFNGDAEYEYECYLRAGGSCGVTACDDNHRDFHHFGGFTYVYSPDLSYDNVINALEKGDFYASTGPVIYDAYIEDGKLHISTSPCCKVGVFSDTRACDVRFDRSGQDSITEAELNVGFAHKYLRITVIDSKGKKACTRAYFNI